MDGVVTNLPKEPGEMVIGAMSFSPTVIMTVADLSVMECEVMVDETDFRNLKLGQEAEVKVDALEDLKLKGEVTEIGASALVRGSGASAAADEHARRQHRQPAQGLQGHDHDQGPAAEPAPGPQRHRGHHHRDAQEHAGRADPGGGRARGRQGGQGRRPGALRRPRRRRARATPVAHAARREKGKEKDGVFVVDGEKVAFKPVKTGIMGETDIEITEGVNEGEEIVTGSYKTLRTLKDQAKIKTEQGEEVVSAASAAASAGRRRANVIHAEDLWRTYQMGAEEIHALRGVTFDDRARASTWPSWDPRARASRR